MSLGKEDEGWKQELRRRYGETILNFKVGERLFLRADPREEG